MNKCEVWCCDMRLHKQSQSRITWIKRNIIACTKFLKAGNSSENSKWFFFLHFFFCFSLHFTPFQSLRIIFVIYVEQHVMLLLVHLSANFKLDRENNIISVRKWEKTNMSVVSWLKCDWLLFNSPFKIQVSTNRLMVLHLQISGSQQLACFVWMRFHFNFDAVLVGLFVLKFRKW